MKKTTFLLAAVTLAALAFIVGEPALAADPGMIGTLLLGQVAAVATQAQAPMPWRRRREELPAFVNVVASGKASSVIPRYAATLLRMTLKLGGTAFTKAMITEVRLKLGEKTLWLATGTHLDKINRYVGLHYSPSFLVLDFTHPLLKEIGGEMAGGIDMTKLPDGKLILEITTSGATAPTLTAKATWGPPQGNGIMRRLLQATYPAAITGKQSVMIDFAGAVVNRIFMFYTGASFAASASYAAHADNTGNGAMGAITVSAGAKVGNYQLIIVEPGSNVGSFVLIDPDGELVGTGVVASAFSTGGLAFTLADGSTDFVAGDGGTITVSDVSNGNLSRAELKKDGVVIWDMECAEARFLAKEYGHVPQDNLYVVDFLADNHQDSPLVTRGAASLELNIWMTATDTVTIYGDVNDLPQRA